MSRKVTVEVKTKLSIVMDDDAELSEIMNEMEYDFSDTTTQADVQDMEMTDYEVVDSK